MIATANASQRRSAHLVLALSVTTLVACFDHPDDKVSQMVCSGDNNCPVGYRCDTAARKCVKGPLRSGGTAGGPDSGGGGRTTDRGPSDASQSGGTDGQADAPQTGGAGGLDARQTSSALDGVVAGTGGQPGTGGGPGAGGSTLVDAPVAGGATGTGGSDTGGTVSSGGATGGAATGGAATGGAATGGATGAARCSLGATSCRGDTLLTCDANGNWPATGSPCTYVCRDNACTGECKPSDHKCSADSLLTCDANGNWPTAGTLCANVCRNNSCTGQCKTGATSCGTGDTLLTCDANGNWPTTGTPCTNVCRNNSCTGQCKTGATSCGTGDTLLTCDANGNWPTTGTPCTNVCRNNACTGQCKPGASSCSSNTLRTCDADGNWPTTGTACRTGYACSTDQKSCACALTLCADGRCIDTSADAMNCGACDYACPGQCSGGACKCATQSASNLVPDGGFNGNAATWVAQSGGTVTLTRSSRDVAGCASSGSLLYTWGYIGYTSPIESPCFPISAGTAYDFGGWVLTPSGSGSQGLAGLAAWWYTDANCMTRTSSSVQNTTISVDESSAYDVWKLFRADSVVPPSDARYATFSVFLQAITGTGQAYFDSLYFTPAPGRF